VQRLGFVQERQHDNEIHEREKLALRLENILLRAERGLPPGIQKSEPDVAAMSRLIEALKQENEELKRRLEELETQRGND
jgi:hypothetical protein